MLLSFFERSRLPANAAVLIQLKTIRRVSRIFARGGDVLLADGAHQLNHRALIFFGGFFLNGHRSNFLLN